MLNILIAEDHIIVRKAIRTILERHEVNIVGEANNGREALELIEQGAAIDILLSDISMPEMDGIELIREIKLSNPKLKVIVLSEMNEEANVAKAFQEGASAYLLKNVSTSELMFSIEHVARGGQYLCAELSIKLLNKSIMSPPVISLKPAQIDIHLSKREIEVLEYIAEGLTNKEMSEKLLLSKRTVENFRQSLTKKTNSTNTASLIKYAILNGFIQ
jgi:DNA-binding NarL/FixJ family response regulator